MGARTLSACFPQWGGMRLHLNNTMKGRMHATESKAEAWEEATRGSLVRKKPS